MKIAGIVAEYNPFHNGHKYQIQATRQAGAEGIVAVMSGDCVDVAQRLFSQNMTERRLL